MWHASPRRCEAAANLHICSLDTRTVALFVLSTLLAYAAPTPGWTARPQIGAFATESAAAESEAKFTHKFRDMDDRDGEVCLARRGRRPLA